MPGPGEALRAAPGPPLGGPGGGCRSASVDGRIPLLSRGSFHSARGALHDMTDSHRRPLIGPALAALVAALVLPGCASDTRVLARVGDRTITAEEYLEAAQAVAG